MKKATILAALALSAIGTTAQAVQLCNAPTAAGDATSAVTSGTDAFVKVQFTPKCSANVIMYEGQSQVALGVSSGSSKGKNVFAGSTNGGSVKPTGTTCASGCTTSIVTQTIADANAS